MWTEVDSVKDLSGSIITKGAKIRFNKDPRCWLSAGTSHELVTKGADELIYPKIFTVLQPVIQTITGKLQGGVVTTCGHGFILTGHDRLVEIEIIHTGKDNLGQIINKLRELNHVKK